MSNNQLAVYAAIPDFAEKVVLIGNAIYRSRLGGCDNEAQGQVMAMTCLHRDVDPMTLLETYDIISNKLSMKADAMLAGFSKVEGSYRIISYTPDLCSIEFTRNDQSLTISISWEEAQGEKWPWFYDKKKKSKELKDTWATPIGRMDMLWARVVSRGCRRLAPEIVAGKYTPEEIQDMPEVEKAKAAEDADAVEAQFIVVGQQPPGGGESNAAELTAVVAQQATQQVTQQATETTQVAQQATTAVQGQQVTQQTTTAVQGQQVTQATETTQATQQPAQEDPPSEVRVDDPITAEAVTALKAKMEELAQTGIPDIVGRVIKVLQANGLAKLVDLTVSEGDQLMKTLEIKEIEAWAQQAIYGHARHAEAKAADADIPF